MVTHKPSVNNFTEPREVRYNELGQIETATYYDSSPGQPGSAVPELNTPLTVRYHYDAKGRLYKEETVDESFQQGGGMTEIHYDILDRIDLSRNNWSTLSFTYNTAGDLVSTRTLDNGFNAQPFTELFYTYDQAGNRISMLESYPGIGNFTTTYDYDSMNRVRSISTSADANAFTASFDYDGFGRRQRMDRSVNNSGLTTTIYDYNAVGQLHSIKNFTPARDEISSFTYTYDPAGRRTSMETRDFIANYTYDEADRLEYAAYAVKPGGVLTPALMPNEAYNYDRLGNRRWDAADSAPYDNYDIRNRLLDDGTFTYAFDHNGNMVRKTGKADLAHVELFHYNYKNRLTGYEKHDGAHNGVAVTDARYAYDPMGRRAMKQVKERSPGGTPIISLIEKYIYDGDDVVADMGATSGYAQDSLRARYTHGPGIDTLLAVWIDTVIDDDITPEPYLIHTDVLGSITEITDPSGIITAKYTYDTFGNITQHCGRMSEINRYRYTSREYDKESGLLFLRDRTYDSRVGIFLQEDPKFNQNLYIYCKNAPVDLIDPFGDVAFYALLRHNHEDWKYKVAFLTDIDFIQKYGKKALNALKNQKKFEKEITRLVKKHKEIMNDWAILQRNKDLLNQLKKKNSKYTEEYFEGGQVPVMGWTVKEFTEEELRAIFKDTDYDIEQALLNAREAVRNDNVKGILGWFQRELYNHELYDQPMYFWYDCSPEVIDDHEGCGIL